MIIKSIFSQNYSLLSCFWWIKHMSTKLQRILLFLMNEAYVYKITAYSLVFWWMKHMPTKLLLIFGTTSFVNDESVIHCWRIEWHLKIVISRILVSLQYVSKYFIPISFVHASYHICFRIEWTVKIFFFQSKNYLIVLYCKVLLTKHVTHNIKIKCTT